jgi:hypothetical protein
MKSGPFKILENSGTNTYLIDLPTKFQFSLVLNVEDLTVYHSFASTHELENPPSTIPRV